MLAERCILTVGNAMVDALDLQGIQRAPDVGQWPLLIRVGDAVQAWFTAAQTHAQIFRVGGQLRWLSRPTPMNLSRSGNAPAPNVLGVFLAEVAQNKGSAMR